MACVSKFLRLATAHIPEHLINQPGALNAIEGVTTYQDEYGAWLWVPGNIDEQLEDHDYTPAAAAEQIRNTHSDEPDQWPRSLEEIETLWRYARALDCDDIRLDADEPRDPELPVYEWA